MNNKTAILKLLILYLLIANFGNIAIAGDNDTSTVDLSDKQGVVDPQDLKKHDPKEKSLKTKEPPAPNVKPKPDVPPFEVDQGGIDDANRAVNEE